MTAVDFIIEKLNPFVNAMPNDIYSTICNIIIEAKTMEKEQIKEAYDNGTRLFHKFDAEQYYKETYVD